MTTFDLKGVTYGLTRENGRVRLLALHPAGHWHEVQSASEALDILAEQVEAEAAAKGGAQ